MLTQKFLLVVHQVSQVLIFRTWSSAFLLSCCRYFYLTLDNSQAAIQASKERAGEVSLKHFEWAKVWPSIYARRPLFTIITRIVFLWERNEKASTLIKRPNLRLHTMRYCICWFRLVITVDCPALYLGRTCSRRLVHRWSHAIAQGDMRTPWTRPRLREPIFLLLNPLSHDSIHCQTSLLPENDRTSVSLKEYLAGIDVSMGGRVAEELST